MLGWVAKLRKLTAPAIDASDIGPIDAVLLSHDHHGDNLDDAGRELLPSAARVVTTAPGARRLGGGAQGLEPWASTRLESEGKPTLEIVATPCRHGPPLSRPVAGHVIGFALRWEGQEHGALWITGDTVLDRRRPRGARARRRRYRCPAPRTGPLSGDRAAALHDERARSRRAVRPAPARTQRSRCTTRAGSTSRKVARRSSAPSRRHPTSGSKFGGYRSASAPRSRSEPRRTRRGRRAPAGCGGVRWQF